MNWLALLSKHSVRLEEHRGTDKKKKKKARNIGGPVTVTCIALNDDLPGPVAFRLRHRHTSTSWSSLYDVVRPLPESASSSSGLTDDSPEMGLSFD